MPTATPSTSTPYPPAPVDAPLRVAFLGPAACGTCAAGDLEPTFVDLRERGDEGLLHAALARTAPHAVVVLAPELLPAGALAGVRAPTLAIAAPGAAAPDPSRFDRILAAPGHEVAATWRSRLLPVDDRLFAPVTPARAAPRALFLGRSTEHREWFLTPAKHGYDVVHYASGLTGAALHGALAGADIGIALHLGGEEAGGARGVPQSALVHLAAGHLLLAERLAPTCGLEPGIDFLEVGSPEALVTLLFQLRLRPSAYERVRLRGRRKAEEHRASRVWPRLVADLLDDIRVFGTARTLLS